MLQADVPAFGGYVGDDELSNMMYQQRMSRHSDSDPLRYEKQMIDEWFGKTIVPKVASR